MLSHFQLQEIFARPQIAVKTKGAAAADTGAPKKVCCLEFGIGIVYLYCVCDYSGGLYCILVGHVKYHIPYDVMILLCSILNVVYRNIETCCLYDYMPP